jgi:hypothetical protein
VEYATMDRLIICPYKCKTLLKGIFVEDDNILDEQGVAINTKIEARLKSQDLDGLTLRIYRGESTFSILLTVLIIPYAPSSK